MALVPYPGCCLSQLTLGATTGRISESPSTLMDISASQTPTVGSYTFHTTSPTLADMENRTASLTPPATPTPAFRSRPLKRTYAQLGEIIVLS